MAWSRGTGNFTTAVPPGATEYGCSITSGVMPPPKKRFAIRTRPCIGMSARLLIATAIAGASVFVSGMPLTSAVSTSPTTSGCLSTDRSVSPSCSRTVSVYLPAGRSAAMAIGSSIVAALPGVIATVCGSTFGQVPSTVAVIRALTAAEESGGTVSTALAFVPRAMVESARPPSVGPSAADAVFASCSCGTSPSKSKTSGSGVATSSELPAAATRSLRPKKSCIV